MNCHFCERQLGPNGMNLRDISAEGVCHECGVAVCRVHGKHTTGAVAPLWCPECARRSQKEKTVPQSA